MQFLIYSNVLTWIVLLFISFCLFLVFRQFGKVYLSTSDAITRDGVPIGDKLPEFEAKSFFSKEVTSVRSFQGKPTLISFISPGCKPCQELIPEWNRAYIKYKDKINFLVVGIGDSNGFTRMLDNNPLSGELLLDDERAILTSCNVRVTPFAFIVDESGIVKGKGLCNGIEHIDGLISYLNGEAEKVEGLKLWEREANF